MNVEEGEGMGADTTNKGELEHNRLKEVSRGSKERRRECDQW